jgi:transcriptional regulator with XRE-family HTH domain
MESGFASRLRDALDKKGWSQGELARRIGLTQPAVSQLTAGKREPSTKVQSDIARALEVDVAWLLGGTGTAPVAALTDSAEDLSWHERTVYPDGSRSCGNLRVETLVTTLEVLVREAAQNSNDAAREAEASMEFRLGILSGSRRDAFLKAIGWSTLLPHLEAVAADRKHRSTKRYRQGLDLLESTKQLVVLRIDDYGTSGLIGDDYGDGNFSALVRRSQDTQKERGAAAGGRFGLGAGILSACSAFDVLLFASDLSQPVQGKSERRLIGRAIFPYHQVGRGEYEGPFFFGVPDATDPQNVRRLSAWATDQQMERLWLTRRTGETGTSILIVGFFDPEQGIDAQADYALTLKKLSDEFAAFFWPAIARGRIAAVFSRYDNDKLVQELTVDGSNLDHPYAKLLNGADDVRERSVTLHVPKSKENGDGPYDHNARLLVEVLPPEAVGARQVNEVALCRRPLMVVKYLALPHLTLGARNFRAILLAGEAAFDQGIPTPADVGAEVFLGKAEPAQHDAWTSTGTDLVAEYSGGRKALSEFFYKLKVELKDLVTPERGPQDDTPRILRDLLSLPGTTSAPKLRAYVSALDWEDPGTFGRLAATVKLAVRASDDVAFRPQLAIATESGGSISLPMSIVKCDGASVSADGALKPNQGVREISLVLEPSWDKVPARPALSAVTLDMSIQEKARA